MTIANITIPSFLDTTLSLLAKIYNKKEVKKYKEEIKAIDEMAQNS